MGKFIKWLFVVLILAIIVGFIILRFWQAERAPQGETDLSFEKADLPFTHRAKLKDSLPFLASSAIDIDGDGRDELFLGGGDDQADQIFKFENGGFVDTGLKFEKGGSDASHGAAYIDIDNDGDNDLFVARESGVWFHENNGGQFSSRNLDLPIADNTTPLSIGFGDINKDGLADMYVAGYLKLELVEGETNFSNGYGGYSHLFMGTPNGSWEDVSEAAGVWRQHNTFIGLFADLDNDLDSDLVIAQDTGKVETYLGDGAGSFTAFENPSDFSYPMGVAAGDYDNDGKIDLFFSNVGYTLPAKLLRGNLGKDDVFNHNHMLFHNEGGGKFSDVSQKMNTARFGFGWGNIFADMNLDGRQDILMSQNYARLPAGFLMAKYPGKIFQNYGDSFQSVEKASGAMNKYFGIAPIVSDFNGDGKPDLVWANINGPSLAYMNTMPDKPYLKVRLPNRANSLNAIVTVVDDKGVTQTRQFITSQGLGSDQSRDMIFGTTRSGFKSVKIQFQDGEVKTTQSPEAGSVVLVDRER